MRPAAVLAAAAALHEFTLGQVAAYCNGERPEVRDVLDNSRQFFAPVGGPAGEPRWRVTDPTALRAAIARESTAETPPPRRARDPDALEARLLLAEETLVDCGDEPSPASRRIMATTVTNYLQQVVAARSPDHADWWDLCPDPSLDRRSAEPGRSRLPEDAFPERDGPVSMIRIRTDLALARMTACEANGETMDVDYLLDTAIETKRLFATADVDPRRAARLLDRLWDLSRDLTTPPGHDSAASARTVAPARLLSAVAWRRACVRAEDDGPAIARELVGLLQGLSTGPLPISDDHRMPLYQVLDDLGQGRRRVAVYSDLLHLLPRHCQVKQMEQILPGALVEAETDAAAASHLSGYASRIERDLVRSPFRSDSALIGQVVHVFQDLAVQEATEDGDVVERGERTRAELLTLAGVPV